VRSEVRRRTAGDGGARTARRRLGVLFALVVATLAGPPGMAQPQLPAFPGAEGFGAVATGGRGGDVYVVTTLEPFGEGSLGAALDPEDCGPRIVVFRVSGVIEGDLDITCGDLTIAGQTAPGAGITLRGRIDGYGASPGGNLIIRHIRVRPGVPAPDKASFADAIQLSNNPRVILDHVTASWGTDENVDLFEGSSDITIQWSTIEESRTQGGHPEGAHNKGLIVGPGVARVTVHHVLFAHHRDRCPAIASGPAEVVNTVAYDCKDGFVHHNPADGEFHLIGNTHRRGPSVEPNRFVPFFFDDEDPGGVAYFLAGNRIDDPGVLEAVVDDIWAQPLAHPNFEFAGGQEYRLDEPTDFSAAHPGHVPVSVQDAEAAYEAVLDSAGAFPRDAVTSRTIEDVRDRGGTWGESEPADLLAGLSVAEPPADADGDGMADDWEGEHGLDSSDPGDHARVMASGYTGIEEYVNELADALVAEAPPARPQVDSRRPAPPLAAIALGVSILALGLASFALGLAWRSRRRES
jgi:pectate lyase